MSNFHVKSNAKIWEKKIGSYLFQKIDRIMLTNLLTMNHRPEEIGMFVCQISFGCETSQRQLRVFKTLYQQWESVDWVMYHFK
jgi:hypothetical protein